MRFNEESHLHHPLANQRFREYVIHDRNLQIKIKNQLLTHSDLESSFIHVDSSSHHCHRSKSNQTAPQSLLTKREAGNRSISKMKPNQFKIRSDHNIRARESEEEDVIEERWWKIWWTNHVPGTNRFKQRERDRLRERETAMYSTVMLWLSVKTWLDDIWQFIIFLEIKNY